MTTHVRPVIARISGEQIPTIFGYDAGDPYAIHLYIGFTPIHWAFARELLAAGLFRCAGIGDVRVWHAIDRVYITLTPPGQEGVCLEFPRRDIDAFLDGTYQVVPPGHENININQVIDLIMEDAR